MSVSVKEVLVQRGAIQGAVAEQTAPLTKLDKKFRRVPMDFVD